MTGFVKIEKLSKKARQMFFAKQIHNLNLTYSFFVGISCARQMFFLTI
jgi:hypothetical protein